MSYRAWANLCWWLLTGLVLAVWCGPASGQEQRYRERQVLDPNTNTWVDEEPKAAPGPQNELDEARRLLAENQPRAARKLLSKWLKANLDDERYQEAQFLLGQSYFESRDFWKAAEQFQTVAENSAGELFHDSQGRCVDVARAFLSGQKRILWRIFRLPAYDDGVEILDRVWQREPGSRLGELSLKLKADYFFDRGDMDLAEDEYANLARQYPGGRFVQFAMLRTAEAAEAAFPGIRFDDRPLLEASERYRQFQSAYPVYAERENVAGRLEGIRQERAEKDLDIARWYERTKRSDAALFYYRQIVKDWPNTLAAAAAGARLRALGVQVEPVAEPAPPEVAP